MQFNTRILGSYAAAVAAAFVCACSAETDAPPELSEQPHVVVIVLDTLRADIVGCYGGPKGISPAIDDYAAKGVRFDRVTAPSNWTKPSWAAMITGRHPRLLGVNRELEECLPENAQTLAESFRDAGYSTYGATANPNINTSFNYHQGFDEYRDSHVIWDWMAATGGGGQTSNEAKLAPANELYAGAIEWAKEQNGAPCYIQICTMEMHEYHRGPHSLNRPEFAGNFDKHASPEREYYEALQQSSHDLKAFVDDLKRLPGWEDVLVVITSDHGEGLSDHPNVDRSRFHGGVMYDSNLHVPLILCRPGALPEGREVTMPVRLLDLAPTILEAAGLPAFTEADGLSLMPLVNGADSLDALPDTVVSESYISNLNKIAITRGDWRYIENRDQANPESGQQGQMNPEALQRIGSAQNGKATDQIQEHTDVAEEMRALLKEWERNHPMAEPSECGGGLTDEELDQLKAIGYAGSEDERAEEN